MGLDFFAEEIGSGVVVVSEEKFADWGRREVFKLPERLDGYLGEMRSVCHLASLVSDVVGRACDKPSLGQRLVLDASKHFID